VDFTSQIHCRRRSAVGGRHPRAYAKADTLRPLSNMPRGFGLPQVLTVNVIYQLPIGKGKPLSTGHIILDAIIGNWQTNAIFLARSGKTSRSRRTAILRIQETALTSVRTWWETRI
jgi:hypothetical protein